MYLGHEARKDGWVLFTELVIEWLIIVAHNLR